MAKYHVLGIAEGSRTNKPYRGKFPHLEGDKNYPNPPRSVYLRLFQACRPRKVNTLLRPPHRKYLANTRSEVEEFWSDKFLFAEGRERKEYSAYC